MIEAYELSVTQKREEAEKEEESRGAEWEETQPFWRQVFEESESLLEREGKPEPQSLWRKIEPKLAFLITATLLRPLRRDASSRVWVLGKDVDFDGETKRVTISARGNGKTPINAYELGIDVGELSLRARKFDPLGRMDELVRVDLYHEGREVDQIGIPDATFFQQVIMKTEQSTAKPILPRASGFHLAIRYP